MSLRQVWFTLAAIWISSVVMASPLFVWRHLRERHWRDLVEVWCCEREYLNQQLVTCNSIT